MLVKEILCHARFDFPILFFHAHSLKPGFLGGSDGKESARNAGDPGLIPGSRRSPGGGSGNPLQYSCLEKPMDRGAWRATVYGVAKSQTCLATKPPQTEVAGKQSPVGASPETSCAGHMAGSPRPHPTCPCAPDGLWLIILGTQSTTKWRGRVRQSRKDPG